MNKIHWTNDEINSIVFTFAQAKAMNRRSPAEGIANSMKRLFNKFLNSQIDVEDEHVLVHAVETILAGMETWDVDILAANRAKLRTELLEAAHVFNTLWKAYTRTCTIDCAYKPLTCDLATCPEM
jgi:hypothetical protein